MLAILLLPPLAGLSKRVNTEGRKDEEEIPQAWKGLLDPQTREFWKEGNHLPDEGFLLFAQNPESLQHAKLWLMRMELKAKILHQMQKTINVAQREMVADGLMEDRYWQFDDLRKGKMGLRMPMEDLKRLNFYFLFSSQCPHCKSLAKTLKEIPQVRPLQVDAGALLEFDGLQKTARATKETLEAYLKDGIVPVVVIHDPQKNVATVVSGNRSLDEYYVASRSLLKGGR